MPVTCNVTDPGSLNPPLPDSAPSALLRLAEGQESAPALRQFRSPASVVCRDGRIRRGCASASGHQMGMKGTLFG